MVKGYFYIFGSDGNEINGEITGVPGENNGKVFMGPCKPKIRSKVKEGDWIIGISDSKIKPRKILSLIEVESKPKLKDARGLYPETIWSTDNQRGQIWFRCIDYQKDKYEYIPGNPHTLKPEEIEKRFENDMRLTDTDTLIVGTKNSCLLEEYGPEIDNRILEMIRRDPNKTVAKNNTKDCPFGICSNGTCYGRADHIMIDLTDGEIYFLKNICRNRKEKSSRKRKNNSKSGKNCRSC